MNSQCVNPRLGAGSTCHSHSTCQEGLFCNAFSWCEPKHTLGYPCVSNVDCQDELACNVDKRICEARLGVAPKCTLPTHWPEGMFCNQNLGKCENKKNLLEACGPTAVCNNGLYCSSATHTCENKKDSGPNVSCGVNEECKSEVCWGGVCHPRKDCAAENFSYHAAGSFDKFCCEDLFRITRLLQCRSRKQNIGEPCSIDTDCVSGSKCAFDQNAKDTICHAT